MKDFSYRPQSKPRAFTASLVNVIYGGDPRIVWIMGETETEWVVEPVREPGNDMPVKEERLLKCEWQRERA